MFEITLQLLTAFIVLIIGTYTDFKTREVPDWINYGLIIIGVCINAIYSIVFSSWSYLIYSLFGLGICFIISLLMFYTGQWGGGDSKMLMGLGASLGFKLNFREEFLSNFLINLIIIGGFYGLVWSIALAIRNKSQVIRTWKKLISSKDAVKIKNILFIMVFVMVVFSVILKEKLFILYIGMISIFIILTFYLWIFIKCIENTAMLKSIPPNKLTEGDWIAKDTYVGKKYICGPKDLGISKSQIKELKRLYNLGKIKSVLVKEGIPFVPSFLVAFVITFFVGSVLRFIM